MEGGPRLRGALAAADVSTLPDHVHAVLDAVNLGDLPDHRLVHVRIVHAVNWDVEDLLETLEGLALLGEQVENGLADVDDHADLLCPLGRLIQCSN